MKDITLENISVYYNDYNFEKNTLLKDFLNSKKFHFFLKNLEKNIIVVLWWDGTMLEAINKNYAKWKAFLGINFWTKWFLLNDKNILETHPELIENSYDLLECNINGEKTICFNDFDIKAGEGKMIELDISVSNSYSLKLLWDWIIISTPAGSTWYNSSLWWPILPHNLNALVITPKATWKPKNQAPIIINSSETLSIKNTWRIHPIEFYSDGKFFKKYSEESLEIQIKKNSYTVKLLSSKENKNFCNNKVLE